MSNDYDVIISGAGIVGSYIGMRLMEETDLDVLILERTKAMKDDSGIVSADFLKLFPSRLVEHEIREMNFISPSGLGFSLKGEKPYALITSRERLSKFLRNKIRKNISYESVSEVFWPEGKVEVKTDQSRYTASLLIGCDGTNSLVRRKLGFKDPKIFFGILSRTKPLKGPVRVWLNKHYSPDFFAWSIPQTGEWGTIAEQRAGEYFEHFRNKLGFEKAEMRGYPIPVGAAKSSWDRTMLVGEAAGQSKPLTGGGYIFGLRASQHAISAAKRAFELNVFGKFFFGREYDRKWKKEIGGEIAKQKLARKFYRRLTNRQIDRLFELLGPHIDAAEVTDYDALSEMWKQIPKSSLVKAGIASIFDFY
jgi:flavin-dependent dehydrogenase